MTKTVKFSLIFATFVILTGSFFLILNNLSEQKPTNLKELSQKSNKIGISIKNLTEQKKAIGKNLLLYPDSTSTILKDGDYVYIRTEGNFKFSEHINTALFDKIGKSEDYYKIGKVNENFKNFFNNDIILSLSECSRDVLKTTNFKNNTYDLEMTFNFHDSNKKSNFFFDFDTGFLDIIEESEGKQKYFNCTTYPLSYKSAYYLMDSIILPKGTKVQM